MANNPNLERYKRLLAFMHDYDITAPLLAERLGFRSVTPIRYHFKKETCPPEIYNKMIAWGFPADLLPRPEDKRRGASPRWEELARRAAQ